MVQSQSARCDEMGLTTRVTMMMGGLVVLTAAVLGSLAYGRIDTPILLDGVAAVGVILLLAVLLGHLSMRPLVRMTAAVAAFTPDESAPAPMAAAGEVGVLARAFQRLAAAVRDRSSALDRERGKRRHAEAELEQCARRERMFIAVVESSRTPVIAMTLDGTITAWNPAGEQLYRYTAAEAIGSNIEIIIPADRRDEHRAILGKALKDEPVEDFATVRLARDGRRIDVALSMRPVKSSAGEIIGLAKITLDITAQKFAEEKFRLAVESCPSGMVMIDSAGKIVMANGEIERLFGYPRVELIGQPVDILVPENLRPQHVRHRDAFTHNPEARRMGSGRDLFGRRKDGSEFPVEVGLNPIQTREGLHVLGVIVDITERTQAEEMFRLAVEAYPSGMVMIDAAGRLEMVNSETEQLFGYRREELIGRPVDILVPARLRSQHAGHREQFARQPEARRMGVNRDLFGVRKDGTEFPVEVGLNPIRTRKGLHVLSVIVDISERKRIERLKDEFVSTVSHELRTPLTSISASLGLLTGAADVKLPEATKRLITIAHSNSQRLVRLINDILDIEKIESGKVAFRLQRVEVRSLIAQAIESSRALADGHGVRLRFEESPVYEARSDPDRLMQVVANLLSNAIKFSPPSADVVVAIESRGEHVRITVRDHGPGIPEDFRARIFEKFAQADSSNQRQGGGTGLGLSIVKQIVLRLGGDVGFSDPPGGGTVFHVDLPRAGHDDAEHEECSNGARILLCEDDSDVAAVMRDRLHQAGFATDHAQTAADAIARAATTVYSAILVDLELPDSDGISLIQQLRAQPQYGDTPIVVVSTKPGRGDDDLRSSGLNVLDWLSKPLEVPRLLRTLRASIARNGSVRLRVLHLDDDPDVLGIVAQALDGEAQVVSVATVEDARRALAASHFDLAVIDLTLDGRSGLDLLPDLHDSAGEAIPVVIYSAQGANPACAARVKAALTQSRASIDSLIANLRKHVAVRLPQASEEKEPA
jgi:PAS domain S-box-containing protein